MYERTLPIGTVVALNEGEKQLMIIGYYKYGDDPNEIFDYAGCLFPEGFMGSEQTYMFNHEDIRRIYFIGYQDEARELLEPTLRATIGAYKK